MKKLNLGKSALQVSAIGLGTINFGTTTKEADAFGLLDAYVGLGGNFIDTSNNYAIWNGGDGNESERTIGSWLRKNGGREKLVIATKVGARPRDDQKKDFSNMQGLSRCVIKESVKNSLKHLQSDYIDLLYLHVDDYQTPQEETLDTLHELMKQGVVREIGCSNFRAWRIETARKICKKHDYPFFCAVQQRHSYLLPASDADFFPQVVMNQELEAYLKWYGDVSLVAYSPLLGGQYNQKEIKKDAYRTFYNETKLRRLMDAERNPNIWVLRHITEQFGGSVALLTTSKVAHLEEIMGAAAWNA